MIEAVFGIVVVVCDFSEGGDFVASIAEISREFFEFGARFGVIGFSAVTRGVKSGEKSGAAGGAARRGDERMCEEDATFGKAAHVWGADTGRAIWFGIELAVVVGEEDDYIGRRGSLNGAPEREGYDKD